MRFANLTQPMPLALSRPIPFLDKSSVVFYTQFQRCGASVMDLSGRGNTGTLNNQSVANVTFTAGGAGTGTITSAGGSMGVFTSGRLVTVTGAGTAANNGTYTITASDANTLTVKPDVTTDAVASGTVTEVATSKYESGAKGTMLEFNGGGAANDMVTITDHSSLNITDNGMTIAVWCYPTGLGEGNAARIIYFAASCVFHLAANGLSRCLGLLWDFDGATNMQAYSGDVLFSFNTWNHFAVTWTGGATASTTVNFYINGSLVAHGLNELNGAGNRVSDSGTDKVIGNSAAANTTFAGYMKSLLIANRVYTANEINRMYLSGI